MAVYPGVVAPAGGWGKKRLPICFTGVDARTMVRYIFVGGVIISAAIGMVIGVPISFFWGLEGVPRLIGVVAGASVGVGIALYISTYALGGGNCTCPPGSFGFCINVIYFKFPSVNSLPPWPPFIEAAPTQCPVLIPPGCL